MIRCACLLLLVACATKGRDAPTPEPSQDARPIVSVDASAPTACVRVDKSGAIIAERAAQRAPKMKLNEAQAAAAIRYVRVHLTRSAALRRLHTIMPHSTVELVRAIEERGLDSEEADEIARYLADLVESLDFAKLRQFDINHSHVTGRQWHEIDYSGESMTWQGQKAYWSKKGVLDFKKATHIHRYMKQAYRMKHFAKVYRPRRSFDRVRPPPP